MTRQTANLTAKSSLSAVEAALAARRDLHIRATDPVLADALAAISTTPEEHAAVLAASAHATRRAARESLRLAMSHATTVVHEQPETAPTPNYDWRVQ